MKVALHFLILAPVLLVACGAGPRPNVVEPVQSLPGGCNKYSAAISVVVVTGGQETSAFGTPKISNDEFSAALHARLSAVGIYGASGSRLNAAITDLDQPAFSRDTTVNLTVHYSLDDGSGDTKFDQMISSSYTAPASTASKGAKRVRMANEGAAKANIEEALKALCSERRG